jgi:hypothetical protein
MSAELDTAVAETSELLQKVVAEKDKKDTSYNEFKTLLEQLENKKIVKTPEQFKKKKGECDKKLQETIKAATEQRKLFNEAKTKIKAAKAKLTEEQAKVAARKADWTKKDTDAKAHNDLVDKLNKPGPEREKLKVKPPAQSVMDQIEADEESLLNTQWTVDRWQVYSDLSETAQQNFTKKLERKRGELEKKKF